MCKVFKRCKNVQKIVSLSHEQPNTLGITRALPSLWRASRAPSRAIRPIASWASHDFTRGYSNTPEVTPKVTGRLTMSHVFHFLFTFNSSLQFFGSTSSSTRSFSLQLLHDGQQMLKTDKEWQRPHATTWKTAQSPVASRRGASRGIPRGMSCWPYGLRDRICLAV